jgi:hypothetical protein
MRLLNDIKRFLISKAHEFAAPVDDPLPVPSCLAQKIQKSYILSALVILSGIFFIAIGGDGKEKWLIALSLVAVAVYLSLVGRSISRRAKRGDIEALQGVCIEADDRILSTPLKKKNRTYIIRGESFMFSIVSRKGDKSIPINADVIMYIKPNSSFWETNGVRNYTEALGYALTVNQTGK